MAAAAARVDPRRHGRLSGGVRTHVRGMIVVALASLAVPLAFLSPFLGLLAYCWLSYMRPQDMAWGVGHISFGMYTAVALLLGLLVRLKFDIFRWNRVTIGI